MQHTEKKGEQVNGHDNVTQFRFFFDNTKILVNGK